MNDRASVNLLWIPLGAGGSPLVRASGWLYERLAARRDRRPARALYHSALEVRLGSAVAVIEMAPVWSCDEPERGVMAEGAVGGRLLGRSRWFRYEVRCWPGGRIPDREYAAREVHVPTDPTRAGRLLDLATAAPTPVWGRDELGAGEMWNSNSVIAWLLLASGHDLTDDCLPTNGRAPGWRAGVVEAGSTAAARQLEASR